ncbi:MAG TPA: STAS domain-containing protein [Gaiellaceae bacterium]|nr:STAS domain-containing protein [Gaiellaceae bacterium]
MRPVLPATAKGAPSLAASEPSTVVFVVGGPITRGDVPELCERARACLERCGGTEVVCDVGALVGTDATTIEAVARLQLLARRLGRRIRLRHASPELRSLLELSGLAEAVPCVAGLRVEPLGEPEQREEGRSVQERVEADDPAV